jgi:hypothetical protein
MMGPANIASSVNKSSAECSSGHNHFGTQSSGSGILTDITFLELFPVVIALNIWGESLRNRFVLFHIDNQAVMSIITKKSSRSQVFQVLVDMEQSIRTFTSSFKCSKGWTESHKEYPLLLGTISGTPENHRVGLTDGCHLVF